MESISPTFPGEAFSPEPAETLFGGVTLNIDHRHESPGEMDLENPG